MSVLFLDNIFKINFSDFLNKMIFSARPVRAEAEFVFIRLSDTPYYYSSVRRGRARSWKPYYLN
jgi:hypothetical protein